jgi:hypothetical protein
MVTASHPPTSAASRLPGQAWLLLPLVCHFGFSWIGFNPTDDGWMQAVARRMLDGEFPHRDFIFVRPALSAVFQIPLVWAGGDHTIWLSRLWGWLTIGGITWIWSGLAVGEKPPPLLRPLLYGAAFLLTAHVFPVMAWHSLDGLLLCSLAVWLVRRGRPGWAFFCAGLAALCRQNFALFAPLLVLACPDARRWRAMWWAAVPGLLYVAATLWAGAFRDFIQQMLATGGRFNSAAFGSFYRAQSFLWAVPAGAALAWAMAAAGRLWPAASTWLTRVPPAVATIAGAFSLWQGAGACHEFAFFLCGLVAGFVLLTAVRQRGLSGDDRLILLGGLALAWVTAISLGYNSPALAAGVLLCLLWRVLTVTPGATDQPDRYGPAAALVGLLALAPAFLHARQAYPYRDRPVAQLTREVGPVLPGASGLRTNEVTYAVLADLHGLTTRFDAEGHPYVILTDCSAAWIRSKQRNRLPCEWPQETELGYSPALVGRFTDAIKRLPPDTRIIVQRLLISEFSYAVYAVPPEWNYYFAQNWVTRHCRKLEGTAAFDVYAPPAPRAGLPEN